MTGKPLLDKILMGINLLFVLGALGVFLYTDVIYKRPLPSESESYQSYMDQLKNESVLNVLPLEAITTNLQNSTSRLRFVDMIPAIEAVYERDIELLKDKTAVIRDIIISITSSNEPDELNSVSGKILLESKLKNEINRTMGRPVVKKIYFTKFVIQ